MQLQAKTTRNLDKFAVRKVQVDASRKVIMTIGEENQTIVFELLRWLGPGAELVEPRAWREQMKEELQQMLSIYDTSE